MVLDRWQFYSREDFHKSYERLKPYKSGSGKWGLSGIISVPDKKGDFVFFVTLGTTISHHEFKESITNSGILTWQSQPDQMLAHPQIKQLIDHDHERHNIHLLLRTNKDQDSYLYFGTLAYFEHDNEMERPVRFKWQIIDWGTKPDPFPLDLEFTDDNETEDLSDIETVSTSTTLELTNPPIAKRKAGVSTKSFSRIVKPDYALKGALNRKIGLLGEESVVQFEHKRLSAKPELVSKIVHVSKEMGDGAGYDILSFDENGEPRYIEVKTTTGSEDTELFATKNELDFAKENAKSYFLYRVYEFDPKEMSGKLFIAQGLPEDSFAIEPHQFKLKPR